MLLPSGQVCPVEETNQMSRKTRSACLIWQSEQDLAAKFLPEMARITDRQNEQQNKTKISRTLFIMITASLLFWVPILVDHSTQYLCSECVPLLLYHIFTMFRLANSLVNPIIYSFEFQCSTFQTSFCFALPFCYRASSSKCYIYGTTIT